MAIWDNIYIVEQVYGRKLHNRGEINNAWQCIGQKAVRQVITAMISSLYDGNTGNFKRELAAVKMVFGSAKIELEPQNKERLLRILWQSFHNYYDDSVETFKSCIEREASYPAEFYQEYRKKIAADSILEDDPDAEMFDKVCGGRPSDAVGRILVLRGIRKMDVWQAVNEMVKKIYPFNRFSPSPGLSEVIFADWVEDIKPEPGDRSLMLHILLDIFLMYFENDFMKLVSAVRAVKGGRDGHYIL